MGKLSYCGEMVKKQDPDRFLVSLFAPADRREALWTLFALNIEIAKTREVVSETQLGLIRLQWWRDAIGALYSEGTAPVPEHQIIQPLAQAIKAYDLPQEEFDALIYAREFDLEDVLPNTLEGTAKYADFTTTPLMRLALRIAGDDPDIDPVHTVATNYALIGILRAVPFHARQGRCYLPESLLKERRITIDKIYKNKDLGCLPEVIEAVAGLFVEGVRAESRILRASHVLSSLYYKRIRSFSYDLYAPRLQVPPPFKELRVACGTLFL